MFTIILFCIWPIFHFFGGKSNKISNKTTNYKFQKKKILILLHSLSPGNTLSIRKKKSQISKISKISKVGLLRFLRFSSFFSPIRILEEPTLQISKVPKFWNFIKKSVLMIFEMRTTSLIAIAIQLLSAWSTRSLEDRKVSAKEHHHTKPSQTTTILFFTLLLTYGFLETIQIQTQEENVG